MFQFQMVRLKFEVCVRNYCKRDVSIPNGSIKIGDADDACATDEVSIPNGSIKI